MFDDILQSMNLSYESTLEQRRALLVKYIKDNQEQRTFLEFCEELVTPARDQLFLRWCGMIVGIEKDGYAHT
jgi:hypothetical protein